MICHIADYCLEMRIHRFLDICKSDYSLNGMSFSFCFLFHISLNQSACSVGWGDLPTCHKLIILMRPEERRPEVSFIFAVPLFSIDLGYFVLHPPLKNTEKCNCLLFM